MEAARQLSPLTHGQVATAGTHGSYTTNDVHQGQDLAIFEKDIQSGWDKRIVSTAPPAVSILDSTEGVCSGVRRAKSAPTETAYADGKLVLPGDGPALDSCGGWYPNEFCDDCGEPHFSRSACRSRQCPRCWQTWSLLASKRITQRLTAARHAAEGFDRRAVHAVVSPPPEDVRSLVAFERGKREAYSLAKQKGIHGGVCIPHAYRVADTAKAAWEAAESDQSLWTWVRENDTDWHEQVRWSPHYHIIGLSRSTAAGSTDGEWFFRRIRTLEPHRLTKPDSYDDLLGCSRYLLSHCSFDPDESKQAIRWFGSMSPASFSPTSAGSPGVVATIERLTQESVSEYYHKAASDPPTEESDPPRCRRADCDGRLTPIYNAPVWLDSQDDSREPSIQVRRLRAAYQWACGGLDPPDRLVHGPRENLSEYLGLVG